MQGRRLADDFSERQDFTWDQVKPGDYFKLTRGSTWYMCAPSGESGGADSAKWVIIEHEDRTITVSPSLHFNKARGGWHGYLERGVWRPV